MADEPQTETEELAKQACQLERMMPRVMRRLFTLEPGHPVSELPLAQLRVCTILESGPRTLSALAAELGISVSAATQIVDRLERSDFVERLQSADDRRTKFVQLAPHGDTTMRSRRDTRVRRMAESLVHLDIGQRRQLVLLVTALLEAATATSTSTFNTDDDPVTARQEQ